MRHTSTLGRVLLMQLALALAGCSGDDGSHGGPTPTHSAVPTGTSTPNPSATATATEVDTPSPTSTATETPTPRPSPTTDGTPAPSVALQLLDDIADLVCSGVVPNPGGRIEVRASARRADLYCDSFVGHYGSVGLIGFASPEEAMAAFGEPGPEDEIVEIGGALLKMRNQTPACCPDGLLHEWEWARGCWLATGDGFDDTGYRFAPQGPGVVEAMLDSPFFAELVSQCLPRE